MKPYLFCFLCFIFNVSSWTFDFHLNSDSKQFICILILALQYDSTLYQVPIISSVLSYVGIETRSWPICIFGGDTDTRIWE